jgi:phospholipase C
MVLFGLPLFYDPDWSAYRALEDQEIEHDIAAGQLPSVAVVLPDRDDPARSEAPGHPVGPGIEYVQHLVDAVDGSPYRDDTLVLIAFVTAGGYYDHVPPPPPPALDVDASSGLPAEARPIHYGPRVPLLAVGRFARRDHISHVPLEMTSIAVFIEWNWLRGNSLKGVREMADARRYRDTTANNLGSLLDAAQTGVEVPAGHN